MILQGFPKVAKLESKDYSWRAAWITGKLGLLKLIELKCNHNVKLVQQFFVALVFGKVPNIPISWMMLVEVRSICWCIIDYAEEDEVDELFCFWMSWTTSSMSL